MAKSKMDNRLVAAVKDIGLVRLLVVAILGLAGAWFAFALAVSGAARTKNPDAALMFLPRESTALAARADRLFFLNAKNPPRVVQRLALDSLRGQAINPRALRLLGYFAEINGNPAKAEKYVRKAESLSRREAGTQLWLIEAAARKNDNKQALVHYDIVLRTKPDTQAILFPRLLTAIEDPDIRAALKPYVRGRNDWASNFLFFANSNSANLPALVDLVIETGGLRDPETAQSQELDLLSRLANKEYFAEARRLYLHMPGAKAARLTSAAFDPSDRLGRFGPMGWQMIDDPDAGGGFSGSADNDQVALSVFANSSTTRPVSRKLLYLKPGSYTFAAILSNIDRGQGGYLRWQLRCPQDKTGRPVWALDNIAKSARTSLTIPGNCTAQILELVVSGGTGQTGLEATIASVSIVPQAG